MSRLDLGNPADFAKATLSSVAGILSDFTGREPTEWDIQEGSYNGIKFHVFKDKSDYQAGLSSIADKGGRRKVKFQFPYRDGQTTDDLGRKPNTFDFDVLLHGNNYMVGFQRLMRELDKPTPGTLIHPVRGSLSVVPEDFELRHASEQRKAVALRLTFIEHSFTIGEFSKQIDKKDFKSALVKALETIQKIEAMIAKIEGTVLFVRGVINRINAALAAYNSGYARTLSRMNRTFNTSSNVDIPTLLPVNEGGVSSAAGETFPIAVSPNDPFANASAEIEDASSVDALSETTQTALAVKLIQTEVNDLRKEVNSIILDLEDEAEGQAALEFYQEIMDLKNSAILLQDSLEVGMASSQARIIEYVTPRVMSLREVAFENGVEVDRVLELDLLNPSLLSTNFIATGTSVMVPVS